MSLKGNVMGIQYLTFECINRCESDCRSRGREFDPSPVQYFRGDWSWNNFYGHSPPFRWIIQEGLLSVTSESMCTKYWLTACSSLPRKKCGYRSTDRPAMTIAVDLGRKATKQASNVWVTRVVGFFYWAGYTCCRTIFLYVRLVVPGKKQHFTYNTTPNIDPMADSK